MARADPAPALDPDRAVAEWVLSMGGMVDVLGVQPLRPRHAEALADLPPQPPLREDLLPSVI